MVKLGKALDLGTRLRPGYARAGMDFSKIWVKLAKYRLKISPLCEGWHRFLKNLGILVKMLHEGLV